MKLLLSWIVYLVSRFEISGFLLQFYCSSSIRNVFVFKDLSFSIKITPFIFSLRQIFWYRYIYHCVLGFWYGRYQSISLIISWCWFYNKLYVCRIFFSISCSPIYGKFPWTLKCLSLYSMLQKKLIGDKSDKSVRFSCKILF
jgi:hypothetical protein